MLAFLNGIEKIEFWVPFSCRQGLPLVPFLLKIGSPFSISGSTISLGTVPLLRAPLCGANNRLGHSVRISGFLNFILIPCCICAIWVIWEIQSENGSKMYPKKCQNGYFCLLSMRFMCIRCASNSLVNNPSFRICWLF